MNKQMNDIAYDITISDQHLDDTVSGKLTLITAQWTIKYQNETLRAS